MNQDMYIYRLIRYIEMNLNSTLDADVLSRLVFISRMQLHRIFYSAVGHTVKSYIAKRRLSVALAHIKAWDVSLADIAYLAGYSSQQALCRTVKQELDMTPIEYRDSSRYFEFPPYNGVPLHSVSVAEEQIFRTLCLRYYHPRLRGLEDRAVDLFYSAMPSYSGRLFGRNGEQRGKRFCYELLITDTDCSTAELERAGFELAGVQPPSVCMYATVTVMNEEEKINSAWDYLYKTWLSSSMFECTDAPYFEEYLRGSRIDRRPSKLKLYLPIQKRGENMQIRLIQNPDLHFLVSRAKGIHAERNASRRVIDYVSTRHPYSMKMSKEFFVRKKSDTDYTCGVRIGSATAENSIRDPNVCEYVTDAQSYLVFESSVIGDYDRMAEMLLYFARNNRFDVEEDELFAVYDAGISYDNPKIRMYCEVKMLQIDNTPASEHDIIMAT